MGLHFEEAEFVSTRSALAVDLENIACTLVEQPDDRWLMAFSLRVQGPEATLPAVEQMIVDIAHVIAMYMHDHHTRFTPDDGT